MSDLISRKVVVDIAEIEDVFMRYSDGRLSLSVIVDIRALLERSPAVSGEVVGYISSRTLQNLKNNPEEIDGYGISREKLIEDDIAIYSAPQQPQEQGELVKKAVAEALEEAAKICDDYADDIQIGIVNDPCILAETIRALIKRNANGEE